MTQCKFGALTDVGLARSNNEDAILCRPDLGLWLVADGMGGHEAGEVASDLAQVAIAEFYATGAPLAKAIYDAHHRILQAVNAGEGKFGMGSTVIALSSAAEHYCIAWVGDSRAYRYSAHSEPRLSQLSTDHSYVQSLFKAGLISRDEMAHHPDKNIITQCLGSTELDEIHVDSAEFRWRRNERVLLCSDGLSDFVDETRIGQILAEHSDPQQAANQLVQAALSQGGKDNVSVIVIDAPQALPQSWWQKLRQKWHI